MSCISSQSYLGKRHNALEMFSSQQAYRLFHLQKMRYLALKPMCQWCSSARWMASVCTSLDKTCQRQSGCGGSPVWCVTEKAPSDTCLSCAAPTWSWRDEQKGHSSPVFSDTKSSPLPCAEWGARKLQTWKPCTLKRCYSIHPASPVAPCAPHFGVLQTRHMTRKGHFPPTLEEPSQITLTVSLNDKQPWALFKDTIHL